MDFLEMKKIIEKYNLGFGWRLTRWGGMYDTKECYAIALDNGSQTYHYIYFNKNRYDNEYVLFMCKELADRLNIECDVRFD